MNGGACAPNPITQQYICHCPLGYYGNRCQYGTYYVMGKGVLDMTWIELYVINIYIHLQRKYH